VTSTAHGGKGCRHSHPHRTVPVIAERASLEWLRTCNTGTGVRLSGLVSAPRPAVEALP